MTSSPIRRALDRYAELATLANALANDAPDDVFDNSCIAAYDQMMLVTAMPATSDEDRQLLNEFMLHTGVTGEPVWQAMMDEARRRGIKVSIQL